MAISIEITSLIIDTVNFNIGFIIKKFIVFMGDQKIKSWEQYILSLGTSILNSSISMAIIYMLDNWTDIRDENILKGLTSLILLSIIYPVNRLIFGRRK